MSDAFHLLTMARDYRLMAVEFPWSRAFYLDRCRFYIRMSRNYPSPVLP